MAVYPGTYFISVNTKDRLPTRYATDNGVGKEITFEGGDPIPSSRQIVRIVALLCLLFGD